MTIDERGKTRSTGLRKLLSATLLLLIVASSAQSRTLQLRLDGQDVPVELSAPAAAGAASSNSAVILVHGFTRDRSTMAGHADMLAGDGYWAVAPDLPYTMDSRDNALVLRELIRALRGGAAGTKFERFVLVGFSAGGLSALLAADEPGVVGYVGLDPFDRPGGVGLAAARTLRAPAYLLRGPSAFCNAFAIAEPWVGALPQLVEDRQLADASHCDFEAPTDRLCTLVCGATSPANQAAVAAFLRRAVRDAMTSGAGRAAAPAQHQVDEVAGQAERQP